MNWHRELPAVFLIFLLLLPSIWLVMGVEVYGQVAKAAPRCLDDVDGEHYGNQPDSYDVTYYGTDLEWVNTTNYTISTWVNLTIPVVGEGIELAAWYAEQNPGGPTVILTHGVRSCKENSAIIMPGAMLYNAGFNVIAFDMRDHGESTIEDMRVSGGQKEWRDLVAVYEWVRDVGGVNESQIGIFGNSMGAATVAIAFAQTTEIKAIWIDASWYDMGRIIRSELVRNNLPQNLATAGVWAGIASTGEDITALPPSDAAQNVGDRSMFILHNTLDERIIIDHGEDMCADGRESVTSEGRVECWFPTTSLNISGYSKGGVGHIVTMLTLTDLYEQKIVAWFTDELNYDLPSDYQPIASGSTPPPVI